MGIKIASIMNLMGPDLMVIVPDRLASIRCEEAARTFTEVWAGQ